MIPSLGMLMSLNDPRRPSDGPPDLEEIYRDLTRRLSGLFGKKGGDSGGRPPADLDPRFIGGGLGLLIGLVALVWLASGIYIVDASQRGLVLQFGRYKETTQPGLQWRLPYPIQSHELVNVSGVRTLEIGYRGSERNKVLQEALMLTDDENIVNIQFAVQYVIKDPVAYVFNNRSTDEAVMGAVESAIREIVGKSKMDYVLYEGREQITTQATRLVQDILDRYESGIQISKMTMQNAQPPEQVQEAFDDAVKAGQDRERQKNEGQAYANDVVPKAKGTAARLIEEANGYKQRVIAAAEGDTSRFKAVVAEYSKAPEVTRQRMYLDTMQQIFANTSKVLVDTRSQGNLLYLPLDKLMQATAASTASVQSTGEVAPVAPGKATPAASGEVPPQIEKPIGVEARSRGEALRRDREGR